VSSTVNGGSTPEQVHYDYDDNGNRLRRTDTSASDELGAYDVQDRLLCYSAASTCATPSHTYTMSGQLQTSTDASGNITTYTYDALGILRAVALPSGTTITYVIDGLGRRVGKMVNDALVQAWLYEDGLHIAAEIDAQGSVTKRFLYATKANVPDLMVLQDGTRYRILSDHLGSPRMAVSETGTVVARWDWDEYGRPVLTEEPSGESVPMLPFGFAGGLYDQDTGLLRFGVRDYDPQAGRWTAKEPLGVTQSANVYAYAGDDPVTFQDYDGLTVAPSRDTLVSLAGILGVGNTAAVITEHQAVLDAAAHGDMSGLACHANAGLQAAAKAVGELGAMAVMMGGGFTRGSQVNEQIIREAMEGAPLASQQPGGVSLPLVQDYVDKLAAGEVAPAIKVDGDIIIDGNHRYIAGRIFGQEPAIQPWLGGRPGDIIPWETMPIDPEAW
jgi:RHS repeat-associated protein